MERLARAAQVFSGGPLPDDLCVVALRSRFERSWHDDGAAEAPAAASASAPRD